jgi:sucrose-6-phosphate hydrolase SacC (GH32 family)
MSKAKFPFWLDGGFDFYAVQACWHHPRHAWWTFRLGDVLQNPTHPDELMTICRGCYVPRCGSTADGPTRCVLWRHHHDDHIEPSGKREPVGGYTS